MNQLVDLEFMYFGDRRIWQKVVLKQYDYQDVLLEVIRDGFTYLIPSNAVMVKFRKEKV